MMLQVKNIIYAMISTFVAISLLSPAFSEISIEKSIIVENKIVPSPSQFASSLASTIVFPDEKVFIAPNSSDIVQLSERNNVTIISSAPFCGQYIGFSCLTLMPEHCFQALVSGSKLIISGVVTNYGLDLLSLRCYSNQY